MICKTLKYFSLISLSILSFSSLFSSCYYDVNQELYPKPIDSGISCDTSKATYSEKVSTIIQTNCNACHSTAVNSGGVSLEGYSNVLAAQQNGTLMGTINHSAGHNAMPLGAAKLSDCDIANLNAWIHAGAPNN